MNGPRRAINRDQVEILLMIYRGLSPEDKQAMVARIRELLSKQQEQIETVTSPNPASVPLHG